MTKLDHPNVSKTETVNAAIASIQKSRLYRLKTNEFPTGLTRPMLKFLSTDQTYAYANDLGFNEPTDAVITEHNRLRGVKQITCKQVPNCLNWFCVENLIDGIGMEKLRDDAFTNPDDLIHAYDRSQVTISKRAVDKAQRNAIALEKRQAKSSRTLKMLIMNKKPTSIPHTKQKEMDLPIPDVKTVTNDNLSDDIDYMKAAVSAHMNTYDGLTDVTLQFEDDNGRRYSVRRSV